MAGRRNNNDPDGQSVQKKSAKDLEQEQEQEQQQETQQETETSRAHNTLGNSALAAMMNARAGQDGVSGDGGGGGGHSVRKRADTEKDGQDYGGDDDVVDEMPISMEDLTESWNPGTVKSEDRPRFVLPMPDDDLPPEDPAFLDAIMAIPHSGALPRITTLDAWLQPSAEVVAASLSGWARAASRWCAPTPEWRSVAALVGMNASFLQSSDARVLPSRALLGAIGSCMLTESPTLAATPTLEAAALVELCLELEGRAHRVDNLISELHDSASKLPKAEALVAEHVAREGHVSPVELPDAVRVPLGFALSRLSRWAPVERTVPKLEAADRPSKDPNDPLGIDDILEAELGPVDRDEAVYRHALQTAERLASAASATRIQFVAVARLVDEVARLWTASPGTTIRAIARQLDGKVDEVLKLLLDVARASQKRSYPPPAVRQGLARAARQIDQLRVRAITILTQVCGGLLPGMPDLVPPPASPQDELTQAMNAGAPAEALPWAERLSEGAERSIAIACLTSLAGHGLDDVYNAWLAARNAEVVGRVPGPRLTLITLALAQSLLRLKRPLDVLPLADAVQAVGRSRRNGLLVAAGALLAIEAHTQLESPEAAAQVRLVAGRLCWDLGARGGLTLLARWTPPVDDDIELSPFFDYSWTDDDEEGDP
ncbi:MAG: hypothetical protein AB8H79_16320 [Myxococcota bacterium]